MPLVVTLSLCGVHHAFCEEPAKVSLCQVVGDRGRYNDKLIEVAGFVSHGFEDFTLFEPGCTSTLDIWLEYVGTSRSGTMYCCGVGVEMKRPEPLKIDDMTIELIEDDLFHEFDRLVQRQPDSIVHATLVGRFFSGQREELPGGLLPTGVRWGGGIRWNGFGHMGCCSLLAIQKVVSIDPQKRRDVDYRAFPDDPDVDKLDCGYQILIPIEPYRLNFEAQRKAESEEHWAFRDPQKVAFSTLAQLVKVSEITVAEKVKMTSEAQGRRVYEWHPSQKGAFYMIVVSRPYWLSFYANDPNEVAWVAIGAYKVCD
jgi:hypothetical protein